MEVQMLHRLAGVVSAVRDDAVAVPQPRLGGDLRDRLEYLGDDGAVVMIYRVDRLDVGLRDHENVHGGLRVNVLERENVVVLKDLGLRHSSDLLPLCVF